ncbi:MAG TPA: EamA family transporter [Alphaproteobacteria bacterium]|jgi:drug/metabolite transporter (DMT)-like permease
MLGALYAVLAAMAFGLNNASARRGVLTGSALQGLVVTIPLGLLLFVPAAMIAGEMDQWGSFTGLQILYLAGGGFMHFVWGRYFNIRSLAFIGSNLAGPMQQSQHIIALALAVILLGETLTPMKVIGILLIALGPIVMLDRQRAEKAATKPKAAKPQPVGADIPDIAETDPGTGDPQQVFRPRLAQGYFNAFLAGVGYGTSPILVSAGLRGTGLSMLGGLISYIAASAAILLVLALPGKMREMRDIRRASVPWFMLSGGSVFVSQFFRYLALGIAPVTIVQPIQSLSLIFRMIFGYFLNREHERLDRWVFLGLGLSFVGAAVLTAGDEFIHHFLTLPPWLAEAAAWSWP